MTRRSPPVPPLAPAVQAALSHAHSSLHPRIRAAAAAGLDYFRLDEDVSADAMGWRFAHDDGGLCAYHVRLGVWVHGTTMRLEPEGRVVSVGCLLEHPTPTMLGAADLAGLTAEERHLVAENAELKAELTAAREVSSEWRPLSGAAARQLSGDVAQAASTAAGAVPGMYVGGVRRAVEGVLVAHGVIRRPADTAEQRHAEALDRLDSQLGGGLAMQDSVMSRPEAAETWVDTPATADYQAAYDWAADRRGGPDAGDACRHCGAAGHHAGEGGRGGVEASRPATCGALAPALLAGSAGVAARCGKPAGHGLTRSGNRVHQADPTADQASTFTWEAQTWQADDSLVRASDGKLVAMCANPEVAQGIVDLWNRWA